MVNHDEILLRTGLSPDMAAEVLREALSADLLTDNDTPVVYRPVGGEWASEATVGGPVYDNYLRDESAGPDEQSIYDFAYDTLYKIRINGPVPADVREQVQHQEARKIFTELAQRLPYPVIHTSEGGLIHAAWNPERGRTDFPPNTTSDESDRELWEPYALHN